MKTKFIPPFLAYLASVLVFACVAKAWGFDPLSLDTYFRWDSGHYLNIATEGHTFLPCEEIPTSVDRDGWCGSAGWFPLYPFLIRVASSVFQPNLAALVVSHLCAIFFLIFCWNTFLQGNRWALTALAFWSGHYYFYTMFPLSLFALLLAVFLALCQKNRFKRAGFFGALLCWTYPPGFLAVPALVAFGCLQKERPFFHLPNRSTLIGIAVALSGIALLFLYYELAVGEATAFLKVQQRYGHATGTALPFHPFFHHTERGNIQTPFTFFVLLFSASLIKKHWAQVTQFQWALFATLLGFWLFPQLFLNPQTSLYRSEAMLFGLVFLIQGLKPRTLPAVAILGSYAFIHMTGRFLLSLIV